MELKGKHKDYLFLGSSRMANTIAGKQFDSTLHTTSINLATAGSSYGESFVLFQQYLNQGNTTETLVLTFDLFKSKHNSLKAEVLTPLIFKHFDFFPYYKQPEIQEVYSNYTDAGHLALWTYLPFARYAEFNNYFKVDSMFYYLITQKTPSPNFNSNNGEQLIYKFDFKGKNYAAPGGIQLGPRAEKYLLAILNLAKKHKIKIILVTAPYFQMKSFDRKAHTAYLNFLKKKYDIQYLDFTASKDWTKAVYFSDAIHTNSIGSRLLTKMLADSIGIK